MSAYTCCPKCMEDTLDVDTLRCECGYSAPVSSTAKCEKCGGTGETEDTAIYLETDEPNTVCECDDCDGTGHADKTAEDQPQIVCNHRQRKKKPRPIHEGDD